MPKRIQFKKTRDWQMPLNTVFVGSSTIFGTPFSRQEYGTAAVAYFEGWLLGEVGFPALKERRERMLAYISLLTGCDLACWCREGKPCHADVLLRLANAPQYAAA